MRIVLQRVLEATVRVDRQAVARIGRGLLVLVGVERGDGERQVALAARKLSSLRVFEDAGGLMNLAVGDVGGSILVVSNFTLAASLRRGRRPSFDAAAPPAEAGPLVARLVELLREGGLPVASGVFGAHMRVELSNDGPVTLILDSSAGETL